MEEVAMEKLPSYGNYLVAKWTICNFSCWNLELHGASIPSPEFDYRETSVGLRLYPKGLEGQGEQIVVQITGKLYRGINGLLTFISSDGSVLYSEVFYRLKNSYATELPRGPKFEDVLAHIKRNEPLCEDLLTVKFEANIGHGRIEYLRTTCDVFSCSFKFSPSSFSLCPGHRPKFGFPVDEGRTGFIELRESGRTDYLDIEMSSLNVTKSILVVASLSVQKCDEILRTVVNERIISQEEKWTFSIPMSDKEIKEDKVRLLLRIKIIGNRYCYQFACSNMNNALPSDSSRYQTFDPCEPIPSNRVDSVEELTKDLMCLYQDQDLSDITLKCHDVTFPVHKLILSARSPVFKTMLSTEMKESASSEVDIGDLDPSTLSLFLTYLYTGAVEDLQSERALNLYYAADKYQVSSLKRECAEFFCSNVSFSNVCDVLSLGDKHRDDQITSVAHDFILKNFNEVLASEQWESFMKSEPLLAVETITEFARNKEVRGKDSP